MQNVESSRENTQPTQDVDWWIEETRLLDQQKKKNFTLLRLQAKLFQNQPETV